MDDPGESQTAIGWCGHEPNFNVLIRAEGHNEGIAAETDREDCKPKEDETARYDKIAHDSKELSPTEQVILDLLIKTHLPHHIKVLVAVLEYLLVLPHFLVPFKPFEFKLVVLFLKLTLLHLQ